MRRHNNGATRTRTCPMRCADKKPPCEPPTTPTRAPSATLPAPGSPNDAHVIVSITSRVHATMSLTSVVPIVPVNASMLSRPNPVLPR